MKKLVACLCFFSAFGMFSQVHAQVTATDFALLKGEQFTERRFEPRHIHFLTPRSKNPVIRYNPVTLVFGSMLYVYQAAFSPQISAECRFQMSCSGFSKQSIGEFGLIKGIALSADRIMKCNRLAMIDARPGDYDVNFRMFDTPSKYRIHR